jgi:carboxymethylenebutenolidase
MDTPNALVLPVTDGTQLPAYVAWPTTSGPAPGLILCQEAFGVNHHIRSVADRLAAAGYVVIAPELFHRTAAPGTEFAYTDFAGMAPHFHAVNMEGMTQDVQAAYAWLQSQEAVRKEYIGAIGFCLGGRVAFLANVVLPLQAAVSYYGGGLHTLAGRAPELHAPHLFY